MRTQDSVGVNIQTLQNEFLILEEDRIVTGFDPNRGADAETSNS
jgi:hypothetical protein